MTILRLFFWHVMSILSHIVLLLDGEKLNRVNRYDSPQVMQCRNCGWIGLLSMCLHSYRKEQIPGSEEVEPVDKCPKCRGEI